MHKIIVTCPCGQRMQVARSAYGKIGVCPKCNQKIRVGANGAEPLALPSPGAQPAERSHSAPFQFQDRRDPDLETAKREFARAVDFFYHARYADSLTILDGLRRQLPANAQIETAYARCLEAINAPAAEQREPAPEPSCGADFSAAAPPPEQAQPRTAPPQPAPEPPLELTAQAVRQTVLHLMTSGAPDSVRLQAAELASRILGLVHAPSADPNWDDLFSKVAPSNGNGKLHVPTPAEPAASVK